MKYSKGYEKLGLPNYFKFGIELEADNVKTTGKDGLYNGKSAEFIKSKNWHMATKLEEALVSEGGAELVSPILTDCELDWENISLICNHMKKFPGNNGDKVVTNDKCGLHVHFDAECLSNPEKMKNFLKLYAESEELLYKMCNDVNSPIRKNAINKDLKGIHLISSIWRNGAATPSGKKILKHIENGTLKVSFKKFGKLKMLASKLKLDERRYKGLNLTNIGNSKKNTIEFRMSNGTLDPNIIKQNVFLYSSLISTAINITEKPKLYEKKLSEFFKSDITEQEKAENFLNLIMDEPEDRKIYMSRWKSVKDAPVFQKNDKKGFSQNRFTKNDFKPIVERTSPTIIHNVYNHIKSMINRTKEREEDFYDR